MNNLQTISCTCLSETWCYAFLQLSKPGITALSPIMLEYTGFKDLKPIEDGYIRDVLDDALRSNRLYDCHQVASTIFPLRLWNAKDKHGATKLIERYLRIWPRVKARSSANKRGVYFHRMISYAPVDWRREPINQLSHIITTYKSGNHRRSALVAHIFDPTRDHTNSRQQGFPCLQQVNFEPTANGELTVTGYYVMQYAFERAYGNLLGLGHLAQFMAHEMGLNLSAVRSIANTLRLGNHGKLELSGLIEKLGTHATAI